MMTLNEIFDTAMYRIQKTTQPVNGWMEKLPDSFHYRLRVESGDLTSYQKYYHDNKYVGCIFDFDTSEKEQIREITNIDSDLMNAFYITPHSTIFPHIDHSPSRSTSCTIVNIMGSGSILKLYNNSGDIVFQLLDIKDRYILHPSKIIHSYEVSDQEAKLINIWHN